MARPAGNVGAAEHDLTVRLGPHAGTARMSVVLPAPLAPIMATIAPSSMSSDTEFEGLQVTIEHIEVFDAQHQACIRAEIGLHHSRIARVPSGRALSDRHAVIEDKYARSQRHHCAHNVLNQKDGQAIAVETSGVSLRCARSRLAAVRPSLRLTRAASARWQAHGQLQAACDQAGQRGGDTVSFLEQVQALKRSRAPAPALHRHEAGARARRITSSSTLSAGNGRTIWNVRAMPRRQIAIGR